MSRADLPSLCTKGELAKALHVLSRKPTPPSTSAYLSLLKDCINNKSTALPQAKKIHAHLAQHRVPLTGLLGDYLILTLAKCGALDDALLVSAQLPRLTVFSWSALVSAYTDSGRPYEALRMHQCMLEQGVQLNIYTFVSLFKACGSIPDLQQGMRFHADAIKQGFVSNDIVGNTLVSMYGKCRAIVEGEHVFHTLSGRDIVSWNAMLSAYVEQGQVEKALQLYVQMQEEDISPDRPTAVTALQACATLAEKEEALLVKGQLIKVMSLEIGQALHVDICRNGFTSNIFVNSTLVRTYGKCGALREAESVFNALLHHDVVSCTAMLSAYIEQGHGEEALRLYRQMHEEGFSPDQMTAAFGLQACGTLLQKEESLFVEGQSTKVMPLEIGQALHAEARKKGFASDVFVGNTLVSLYSRCGAIVEAEDVFYILSQRNLASWNALISAYVQHGQAEMALHLYIQMQEESVAPDQQTYVIALQACANFAEREEALHVGGQSMKLISLEIGQALHLDATNKGFASNIYVSNTLMRMYGKCGAILDAEDVFCALAHRTVVSWSAMLSGYVEQCQGEKALRLYRQMQEEAPSCCDQLTFVIALQACVILAEKEEALLVEGRWAKVMSLEIGQALHADTCRKGFISDVFVCSTLLSMYGKCGAIVEAENVFGALSQRTNVSWSAMLSAYVEQGEGEKALKLYRWMQEEGQSLDQPTLVIALQACAILAEKEEADLMKEWSTKVMPLELGQALHADVQRKGFASDIFVGSTLLSMYGKCGAIVEAENVFGAMSQRTTVSWNAMFLACVGHDQEERVLRLYGQMRKQSVTVDQVTLISILQACDATGSLELCKQVHFDIVGAGYDQIPSMAASQLHAYGSCASMVDAQAFFDELSKPDIVSWNACIAGHVGEGNAVASLHMFEELKLVRVRPSEVSFLTVLSACGHAGLVVQGLEYFKSISKDYGLIPDMKHYGSMLDLLGRAGDFKGIENILGRMPMQANETIWLCLLSACHTHANLELAKRAFHYAVHLHPKQATAYVLMSNIYAIAGLQECGAEVENSRHKLSM